MSTKTGSKGSYQTPFPPQILASKIKPTIPLRSVHVEDDRLLGCSSLMYGAATTATRLKANTTRQASPPQQQSVPSGGSLLLPHLTQSRQPLAQ